MYPLHFWHSYNNNNNNNNTREYNNNNNNNNNNIRQIGGGGGVGDCLYTVLSIGEALPLQTIKTFFDKFSQTNLQNLYGPTETTVHVTTYVCRNIINNSSSSSSSSNNK